MTTYRVQLAVDGADGVVHRAAVASLPNRFTLVDDEPDVVIVSAAAPDTIGAAVRNGPRVVVVDRVGCVTGAQLQELAGTTGARLVVPAPRFGPHAAPAKGVAGAIDLVESTITSTGGPREMLVEQLALVRMTLGAIGEVRVLSRDDAHYSVDATFADGRPATIVLSGVTVANCPGAAELRAIGAAHHLAIHVDTGPLARPARITYATADGERTPFPVHQSALRLTLVALHAALVRGDDAMPYRVDDLRADVLMATALS